ncbi:unnamed protein product [Cylindrotheca closterium]|uniref:Uncharacterized protein n=1 Tax=Cylindrotheca closterium TaxID=2856 RepID=A0AAD2CLD8_9STRA|nr:unnamed protein product [Cylindrotheca closterium]
MRGKSNLFHLLCFKTFLITRCFCFSPQRQHFETTVFRNSIRFRPSRACSVTTSLSVFPRNDAPGGNTYQSSGSNFVNNGYLDSLSAPPAEEIRKEEDSEDSEISKKPKAWKDPFSSATSAFSNVVRTGSNDIRSAATAATTGFGALAQRGTSDISNVVRTGSNDFRSAATAATTGFGAVAQRGTSDMQAFANKASFNAKREAAKVRSFYRKGTGKVGGVALWIDGQAKMGTQAIGSQARSVVVKFTGKEDYEFGDIVKETLRRILSQEVSISDTILLLKILLAIGASIGPLAELLPVAVLLQGLNVSLETQIGGKILEALAHSLDNRFVAAFTGDDKFLLGAAAKKTLLAGILKFTGKSTYEAGDIQRTVEAGGGGVSADGHHQESLQIAVDPELEAWDKAFTESVELEKQREQVALLYSKPDGTPLDEESAKELDMKLASELEEWSSVFRKDYADYGL